MTPPFSPSSRARLTTHDRGRFPGGTLFDRLGRALCEAACLPRKELFESWEVARRTRRLFRGGRIVDLGGGHGLLAQIMLILDDTSSSAVVVDTVIPPSAAVIHTALLTAWPRLRDRITFMEARMDEAVITADDVVVSSHACGALTDRVIERAGGAGARLAVLPCCHARASCDVGPVGGWLDDALAIDVMRAVALARRGYRVWTQEIPAAITPKNRLLIGAPR